MGAPGRGTSTAIQGLSMNGVVGAPAGRLSRIRVSRYATGWSAVPCALLLSDEPRDGDRARLPVAAVERNPAIEEEPVAPRADDRVGRRVIDLERRAQSRRARVLRISGQEARRPRLPAVRRPIQPRATRRPSPCRQLGERYVDAPIVVAARETRQRIAARAGDRRLVLPLQRPVAVLTRAGYHIDVGARSLRRWRALRRGRGGQRKTQHRRN